TPEQISKAAKELTNAACLPFDAPKLRKTIVEVKRRNEQTIDIVSQDEVIYAGPDQRGTDRAKETVETFRKFVEDNRSELLALQIFYSQPYRKRHLTLQAIEELAKAIKQPPANLTTEQVWAAYERLERSKVHGAGPQRILTDI